MTEQLNALVKWLRWPENKNAGAVPWFVVLWRIPWFALIYAGCAVAWIGVAACYGLRRAKNFWSNAT